MAGRAPSQKQESTKAAIAPDSNPFAPRPFAPPAKVAEPAPEVQTVDNAPAEFSIFASDGGSPPPLQRKLTIGAPNDPYEQEADRVAKQVVQQINAPGQAQPTAALQRENQAEDELQRASTQSAGIVTGDASPDLETAIARSRGRGQPLAPKLQTQMGQAMGADFSNVNVHTDSQSDQLNRSIQAKAFTTGQDVFFRQGAYQPGSQGGQELIAHELTHVMQQDNSEAIRRKFTASGWGDDFSAVMSSDAEGAEPIIQKIADDPMSIKVLKEIEEDYNAKPKIKYQVRAVAATLRGSKENRYSALSKYAQEHSHDTGIIYKDSYPHCYYLWVNCITSQTEFLEANPQNEEQELQANNFKTVILGVGPAAAYYIMGLLPSLTPNDTAIIGFEQPWDSDSPLARAIAINHENQAWTLDPTASGVADSGDNRSRELTEQIQKVRSAVTWKNAEVISTEPENGKNKVTYRVKGEGSPANADNDPVDEERVLYADLVISALGGGQEAISRDQIALDTHNENLPESMEGGTIPPVFTLNEYQRWLSKQTNKDLIAGKTVIISGANAGVDAVYTSTQADAIVSWVVASGMAYAPAMQNTNIQWHNVNTISYGYATLGAYEANASDNQRVRVQNKLSANHKQERNKLKGNPQDQGTVEALNLASGGEAGEIINKIRLDSDDLHGHVYVIAMGQDDSEISRTAGVPRSGDKDDNLVCLRVVYSDGRISSKPILSENGTIDTLAVDNEIPTHDQPNPADTWQALALRLNSKASAMQCDIDFRTMNLSGLAEVRENSEQDIVPTTKIQPVAVYKQYDENDNPGSVQNAKKGTLIIGAQARPYIGKAGYSISAIDNAGQVVDIGQITPARQAIQQITNIAARGAMGKADYTYGTRDEIAATVAVKGLTGIAADLITEAIIWSRSQRGLGQVNVDPNNPESDERLTPAPRTNRMKAFWDAALTELGS